MKTGVLVLLIIWSVVLILASSSAADEHDEDGDDLLASNRENWVDPFDMINHNGNPTDKRKKSPQKDDTVIQNEARNMHTSTEAPKSHSLKDKTDEASQNHNTKQQQGQPDVHDQSERGKGSFINDPTAAGGRVKSEQTSSKTCEPVASQLRDCKKKQQEIQQKHDDLVDKCKYCEQTETSHIKRYIRMLLSHFPHKITDGDTVQYNAQIEMSSSDRLILQKYAAGDKGNMHDAFEVLGHLIHSARLRSEVLEEDDWSKTLEEMLGVGLGPVLQILCILTLLSVFIKIQMSLHLSWMNLLWKTFVILFMISIPWNWWHQYKMVVAKQHAAALREMPVECRPEKMTTGQTLISWFKSPFSFSDDSCAKYHIDLLVDPMWEVAPTKAFAVTLTKFILEPVEHVGLAVSKFLRALLEDLPVHLWPVVLGTLVLLVFVMTIMKFGYRVKLLWLFGLEPCQPVSPKMEKLMEDIKMKIECQQMATALRESNENVLVQSMSRLSLEDRRANEERCRIDSSRSRISNIDSTDSSRPRSDIHSQSVSPKQSEDDIDQSVPVEKVSIQSQTEVGCAKKGSISNTASPQALAAGDLICQKDLMAKCCAEESVHDTNKRNGARCKVEDIGSSEFRKEDATVPSCTCEDIELQNASIISLD